MPINAKDITGPEIGLLLTPEGVRGLAIFGQTLEARQASLALFHYLEPDLIDIQAVLNQKIKALRKGKRL